MELFLMKRANLSLVTLFLLLASVPFVLGATGNVDAGFDPELSIDLTSYYGKAALQPDGKLIIFGSYTVLGTRPYIKRLNADGSVDETFDCPECRTFIPSAVAFQADGKILVGGGMRIIRVDQNGSLDTSFVAPTNYSGNVICHSKRIISQPVGKVLIVCQTQVGTGVESVRRLNNDGSVDDSFATILLGARQVSNIFRFPDGTFLVGGADGSSSGWLNRYHSNGNIDSSFQYGVGGRIDDFAVQPDGKVLFVPGISNKISRLLANGSVDKGFSANTASNEVVSQVKTLPNGQFYVKLFVSTFPVPGTNVYRFVRYNEDGSVDNTFSETFLDPGNWEVDDIDRIITFKTRLFRLNFDGTVDTGYEPALKVDGLAKGAAIQSDGKIIVIGEFEKTNGTNSVRITRINTDGSTDLSFDSGSGFDKQPTAVAIQQDGKILVIGQFTVYNGTPRTQIVRLNADGSLDNSFDLVLTRPTSVPFLNAVTASPGGKILIGGNFETVQGVNRRSLAMLNNDGSVDATFDASLPTGQTVYSIFAQSDGKILFGSSGTLVRLNSNGSPDGTFSSSISKVSEIVQRADGKYLVSSLSVPVYFETVLLLHTNGQRDFTYQPPQLIQNDVVSAILEQPNGNIVFGGSFSTVNLQTNRNISRVGPLGQPDHYFPTIGTNGSVNEILGQPDGKVIFVGNFTGIEDVGRSGIARLTLSNRISRKTLFDFDGDSRTDPSIFRPSVGQWWYLRSSDLGNRAFNFGTATDTLVPADYTGDGKTDIAFFRPASGEWFILRSEDNSFYSVPFGTNGDIPAPGDFDGDGKADTAVFRPSSSTWFIDNSSGGTTIQGFGTSGDKPTVEDFDGDGKDDIAIFRPSNSQWWQFRSTAGVVAYQFGAAGDKTVPGDYTGDGKADVAFWRPASGEWFVLRSEDSSFYSVPFGISTDIPTPGDYDGDGKTDTAIFRPSDSNWYVQGSTSGFYQFGFGQSGDIPVPNAYVRP